MSGSTRRSSWNGRAKPRGRGAWQEALRPAHARRTRAAPASGPDLPFFAGVAYAAGDLDGPSKPGNGRTRKACAAGDHVSAAGAAVRVAMHLLFDTALMAPVRGWMKRAERLLEGHDETPVHAWLAVVQELRTALVGRLRARAPMGPARHRGRRPSTIRLPPRWRGWPKPAASSWTAMSPRASCCSMKPAWPPPRASSIRSSPGSSIASSSARCRGSRNTIWPRNGRSRWRRWRHGQPIGSIHGRCRIHRAEILRLRGSWSEAEQQALAACEELRPYLRREFGWPLMELGRIRLRRGDIEGAEEAFRAAHEIGWDPQPGLALVHLAKGDIALAADSIRDALEHPLSIPSKELPPHTELRQAPLFEAQAEIAVAAGDLALAQSAAGELARIAASFESKPLAASAALAYGRIRLATGDTTRRLPRFRCGRAPVERGRRALRDGARPYRLGVRAPRDGQRRARASWSSKQRASASIGSEPRVRGPRLPVPWAIGRGRTRGREGVAALGRVLVRASPPRPRTSFVARATTGRWGSMAIPSGCAI